MKKLTGSKTEKLVALGGTIEGAINITNLMTKLNYCRFQNTLRNLNNCLEALQNNEKLSYDERAAKEKLIITCAKIIKIEG